MTMGRMVRHEFADAELTHFPDRSMLIDSLSHDSIMPDFMQSLCCFDPRYAGS